ncbi:MAG: hypothetical protein FD174_1924 [Geobacteraceae bacterium]|nr:MAG: hypothetical protein FD174_1924 [Geobacteraceae bacterium]
MRGGSLNDKMCALDDVSRAHSLAEKPSVVCGRCGAKAHEPVNVCDPVQMPEAGYMGD